MTDTTPTLTEMTARIGDSDFVSMVTYRRDGSPVATAMWIAADGPDLVVWTPAEAWKVKRVRRTPRVVLIPSGRTGKVDPAAPGLVGNAVVETEADAVSAAEQLIRRKYGIEFRIVTTIEAVLARGRKPRVAIRISPAEVDSKNV